MNDHMPLWFSIPLAILLWLIIVVGYLIGKRRVEISRRKIRRETYQRLLREQQREYFRNDFARSTGIEYPQHRTLRKTIDNFTNR